jgi:hypothetical protein|tara:strand:+ start:9451 stop:11577 length:2127 start_codon:yes stop_codon:yes gene_type:complete
MMARGDYFWNILDRNNKNRDKITEVSRINTPYGNRTSLYTGAGPDNIVQPNKPALLDFSSGRPAVIHEGEIINNNANGGKTVTPHKDVRRGMMPLNTESQQMQAMSMENGQNGFRNGGIIQNYMAGGNIPSYQEGGVIPPQQPAQIPQQQNALGLPQQQFQPISQLAQQAPQAQTQAVQSPTTTQESLGLTRHGQTGQQVQIPQQVQQQPPQQPAQIPQQQVQQPQQQQGELTAEKPEKQPLTLQSMQGVMEGTADQPQTVGDFKKQWDKRLLDLHKIAGGNSQLFDRMKNTLMGELTASQGASTAAVQQQELQQGLTPETSRLLQQERERSQSMERGNLMNQLTQLESQAAIDATNQAVQQGMLRTQFEIKQKETLANNLIEQGGLENLDRAEDILTEIYGTPIDLQMLKTKKSLSAVADIVALGQGVEDSINLAKQQGVMEQYGLSEEELRGMMTPMIMNTNPIVQAQTMYADLVTQGVITQDQANQAMSVVNWTLMNPQGLEISNSFIVTDANGNQVGNFKTEEEADSFIVNNPDKNYNKQFKKNGWIGLKGDYEEYLGSKVEGDVFEQSGKLFRIVNGEKIPARMMPTVPFSAVNNSLYKYYINSGREEQANEILNIQVNHLRSLEDSDGDIELPAGMSKDHPAYKEYMRGKGGSGVQTQKSTSTPKKKTKTIPDGDIAGDSLEVNTEGGGSEVNTSGVEIPFE